MGIVMGGGYRGSKGGGKPMVLQTSTSREGSKPDTIRERERERKGDADGASRGAVNTPPFAIFTPPLFPLFLRSSFPSNRLLLPRKPPQTSSSRVSTVTSWLGCAKKKKKRKRSGGRLSGVETIGPKMRRNARGSIGDSEI